MYIPGNQSGGSSTALYYWATQFPTGSTASQTIIVYPAPISASYSTINYFSTSTYSSLVIISNSDGGNGSSPGVSSVFTRPLSGSYL